MSEKRNKKRWETREASQFEGDRAAYALELRAQMRVCSLCTQGEESSKAAHVVHFTPPEGLVPECKCPAENLFFTHWATCPKAPKTKKEAAP